MREETVCRKLPPLLLLLLLLLVSAEEASAGAVFCTELGKQACTKIEDYNLTRVDGHQMDHIRVFEVDNGRQLSARTVNLSPLVIEVRDFLNESECERLKMLAHMDGLYSSLTSIVTDTRGFDSPFYVSREDGKSSLTEVAATLHDAFDIAMDDNDILALYKEFSLQPDENGFLSGEDFNKIPMETLQAYIESLLEKRPEKKNRLSKQGWVYPPYAGDEVLEAVKDRLSALTELPVRLLSMGSMQVVRYGEGGHYYGHHDSQYKDYFSPPDNCCKPNDDPESGECDTCRYLTLLMYLNDVTEGGETAFPFANKQWNDTDFIFSREHRLEKNCANASLVVKPARGKAILWYNHFPDPETQGIGNVDPLTYHGGCPVIKGEKWVANFWVIVSNGTEADLDTQPTSTADMLLAKIKAMTRPMTRQEKQLKRMQAALGKMRWLQKKEEETRAAATQKWVDVHPSKDGFFQPDRSKIEL